MQRRPSRTIALLPPPAEIHYRLALRDAPKRQRIGRLHWEINP